MVETAVRAKYRRQYTHSQIKHEIQKSLIPVCAGPRHSKGCETAVTGGRGPLYWHGASAPKDVRRPRVLSEDLRWPPVNRMQRPPFAF